MKEERSNGLECHLCPKNINKERALEEIMGKSGWEIKVVKK